ncbi:MAG: 23S rRNA (guanosine(2251)-2'-O)-methyltransferase RlmB [Candidatus Limnocylindria bacterium]
MSELVGGRRPVAEALASGRRAERLILGANSRRPNPELRSIITEARRRGIPVEERDSGTLQRLAGFDGHQGVLLEVADRRYSDLAEIVALAVRRNAEPLVIVLDSLQDPVNFGSLLRAAEAAGVHGVVFPERGAAPLSPAAVKASAGASEHLLLARVESLSASLDELRARNVRIVAADQDATATAWETDLSGAVAVVVGAEGAGLSAGTRRRCDELVRFPMAGAIGSLNAATAGALLVFEVVRQRSGAARALESAPAPT